MLFREEVLKAKKNRLTGTVVLSQPYSFLFFSIVIFIFFILLILYLTQTHYSRKETVKGYLIPKKGLIKVYSGRNGVLDELFVTENSYVKQGQPIAKIRNSQSLATGVELSVALTKELKKQIEALKDELNVTQNMYDKDAQSIKNQLEELSKSLEAIQQVKITTQKKLQVRKKQYINNKTLYKKGYLSSKELTSVQEKYFETSEENDRLAQEIASISLEISKLKSDQIALPEKKLLKQTLTRKQISELQVQLVELNNQYEFIKKAPESGMVTAIQPSIGSQINTDSPLLSIIPADSPLEIELLLPTRSAGFVQTGDLIKIRFDAFPYQKFGLVSGKITNIDKALILPTDDRELPIKVSEAVYRVRAILEHQSITAYGKQFPLKVGMSADADIILEKRTLLEWLLDPIYIVKGRLG